MNQNKNTNVFVVTFLVCGFLLLWLFLSTTHAHQNEGGAVVVHMSEKGFDPQSATVPIGQTVVFENTGTTGMWPASNIHPTHRGYPGSDIEKCAGSDQKEIFDACKDIKPGETYSFIFTTVGEWRYHDHSNPELKGSIAVTTASTSTTVKISFWKKIKSFVGKFLGIARWQIKEKEFVTGTKIIKESEKERSADKKEATEKYVYDSSIVESSSLIFTDDGALFSYIKKFGPLKATKRLYELEPTLGDCHNQAHDAGRIAYELNGARAFQFCSAECHSGCYHGATEAYFAEHGTGDLIRDLNTICNSELNPFFSHQCIHGIGHGLMAWSDYELLESLKNCDLLPKNQDSCHSGVYMENIVGGLAAEQGHFTKYLNNDPHFPCTIVPEKYKDACYFYQSSRMIQLFMGDFKKVADACNEIEKKYQTSCFQSMGRDVGGYNRGNAAGVITSCQGAEKGSPRTNCLMGAVQDALWDPGGKNVALQFCKLLTDKDEKNACYETIIPRGAQVFPEKKEFEQFCSEVETDFQKLCREYTRQYR